MEDYEATRQANIARNKAMLQQLGLDKPFFEPKEDLSMHKKKRGVKRKADASNSEGEGAEEGAKSPMKARRTENGEGTQGLRRSTRHAGRKVLNYNEVRVDREPVSAAVKSGLRTVEHEGRLGRSAGSKRIHNPKQFGSIPGIAVGTWWDSREGCSADAIHAPWVAGISPSKNGAYSVALSGGYDDDVDLGYAFTYTGSGGRDLKGTKANPKNLRTAPQSSDQTFEHNFNRSLQRSVETGKPVRVIRGYKLKSRYAPSEGYRYDGLYRVEKAWREEGLEGFLVCKYAFKRLPGQPPLPVRRDDDDDDDEHEDKGEDENEDTGEDENEKTGEDENEDTGEDGVGDNRKPSTPPASVDGTSTGHLDDADAAKEADS